MSEYVWESFCDEAYFDMWAIRNTSDKSFNSAIHVNTKEEAEFLVDKLNQNDALVEALGNMVYYAKLIVNPKAQGTIKPSLAMRQLTEAEAALKAAKEGK